MPAASSLAPDDTTRIRLIEAALRLFAKSGYQGVSLRSVNQAAGAKNSGATHYHFGNRIGLVRAVLEHVFQIEDDEIDALVRSLKIEGDPILVEIARFYGGAMVIAFHRPWGRDALAFISQLIQSSDPEIEGLWQPILGPRSLKAVKTIRRSLQGVSELTIKRRLVYGALVVFHGLANETGLRDTVFGDIELPSERAILVDLLKFVRNGVVGGQ